MIKSHIKLITLIVAFFCSGVLCANATEILTVATGSVSGLYYPSGGALCRIFNLSAKGDIKCIVESTPGSTYNLNAIEGGLNNFAFVQANELSEYLKNKKAQNQSSNILTVFPLYTEAFALVVSKNSEIKSVLDLKGKKINIGVEGSGVRNFISTLIQSLSFKNTDFAQIISESQSSVEHLLCNNTIDASIVVSGHPSKMIQNLTENCGAKIIPISENIIRQIMDQNDFYVSYAIPAGMYPNHNVAIPTIGTKTLLITSKYTNEEYVYSLVTYIVKNYDSFKQYSPVVQKSSVEYLNSSMPQFPLHPVVVKAFRENGIN
jgi:TRAP transporter TAXI family solute receptor